MHMSEIHYSYFNTPVFPRNNEKCLSHLLHLKGVKRLLTNLDNEMLKCPKLVWPHILWSLGLFVAIMSYL